MGTKDENWPKIKEEEEKDKEREDKEIEEEVEKEEEGGRMQQVEEMGELS